MSSGKLDRNVLSPRKVVKKRQLIRRCLNGRRTTQYRERKAHFGELVQMDRSHHGWFDGQEDKACLMDMVDDATGRTLSLMSPEETTEAGYRNSTSQFPTG